MMNRFQPYMGLEEIITKYISYFLPKTFGHIFTLQRNFSFSKHRNRFLKKTMLCNYYKILEKIVFNIIFYQSLPFFLNNNRWQKIKRFRCTFNSSYLCLGRVYIDILLYLKKEQLSRQDTLSRNTVTFYLKKSEAYLESCQISMMKAFKDFSKNLHRKYLTGSQKTSVNCIISQPYNMTFLLSSYETKRCHKYSDFFALIIFLLIFQIFDTISQSKLSVLKKTYITLMI